MAFSKGQPEKMNKWGMIMTQAPIWKRDDTECPVDYSLCPASLNGGCCPADRSCGTESCFLTTAAPGTACGSVGAVACNLEQGGGCCPSGYACAGTGCTPMAGSYSQDCGPASYLCPKAVGYQCCQNGMACGSGYCYGTSKTTVSIAQVVLTTDSNLNVKTITKIVETAYVASTVPTILTTAIAPFETTRFTNIPTAVAKVAATSSATPAPGGLTTAQLGGIIGATVAILIAIIAASFFIIRRLNAVHKQAKALEAAGSGGSHSKTRSSGPRGGGSGSHSRYPIQSPMDFDNMSVDPLLMSPSVAGTPQLPRPSPVYSSQSDVDGQLSPPIPAPYGSHPHGYQPVPTTDTQYFDSQGHSHSRQNSNESANQWNGGYPWGGQFQDIRDQNLRFGHNRRPSIQSSHGRQWSDASDVSQLSGVSTPVELEGASRERAGSSSSIVAATLGRAKVGMGHGHKRRSSDLVSHHRRRSSGNGHPLGFGHELPATQGRSGERKNGKLENVLETEHDRSSRSALDLLSASPKTGTTTAMPSASASQETGTPRGHSEDSRAGSDALLEAGQAPTSAAQVKGKEEAIVEPDPNHQRLPEGVLDLEQELMRLEGQKIMGRRVDLLGEGAGPNN